MELKETGQIIEKKPGDLMGWGMCDDGQCGDGKNEQRRVGAGQTPGTIINNQEIYTNCREQDLCQLMPPNSISILKRNIIGHHVTRHSSTH